MTQEQKELFLKDLCARLPYRTKIDTGVEGIATLDGTLYEFNRINLECGNDVFLPYLRPLSSMTEEEQTEFSQLIDSRLNGVDWKPWSLYDKTGIKNGIGGETLYLYDIDFIYDYLNAHHFDYRGLIPMGLALEASEEMYKF